MRLDKRFQNVGVLSHCCIILVCFLAISVMHGCSSKEVSYHYALKQIEHGDLNFHTRLKVDEYINAFPQDEIRVPAQEDVALQVDPFTSYQPIGSNRTLVQIAVKTRRPLQSEIRKPISLCLAVDVSGSMHKDNKMEDTKTALVDVISELRDGDEVALIAFNEHVHTVIPLQQINERSRQQIIHQIDIMKAEGGTNIEGALLKGYREMARFQKDSNKRLLLITDGRSTVGTMAPEELADMAKNNFRKGLRISTIGLGHDYDERLLREISEQGNGGFYFAENAKALTTILREDLMTTVVPVVDQVDLRISLADGFVFKNVYGAQIQELNKKEIAFSLGAMNVNDWRIIIVEVEGHIPAGKYQPVTAQLRYTDRAGGIRHLEADTSIDWQTDFESQQAKPVLLSNVARNSIIFGNATSLIRVGELSEERRYQEALDIIDLQINNNKIMRQLDKTGSLDREIASLIRVRDIIVSRIENSPVQTSFNPEGQLQQINYTLEEPSRMKEFILAGLDLASRSLPGVWSTVAQLFIVMLE